MAFTIYLTQHSHCDLGYTHDLPIVRELARRYIDDALDLADRTADYDDASKFRWTCEVTAIVEHWLRAATPAQVQRFIAAHKRGQMEVCALWANLTPLATLAHLTEMLAPMTRFRRELGLDITAAMNSDVNGFSWALTDLLLDSGISGMTMSINEHFGNAPRPFPGLFRWQTPTAREIPVLSGPTYAHSAWLGICGDIPNAYDKLTQFITRQKTAHQWPHNWYYMQITQHGPQNDNMGPIRHLSPWIKKFNELHGEKIRIELTTPSRFFKTIANDIPAAPANTGEWNDWWAFGESSTPVETTLFRQAAAKLRDADLLSLKFATPHYDELRATTFHNLAHYIEHTWGADVSVHQHASLDARLGNAHKSQFAYNAYSAARLIRRDTLSALAAQINHPGETPATVLFNPTQYPRTETIRIPRRFLQSYHLPTPASILTTTKQQPRTADSDTIEGPFQPLAFTPTPRWPLDQAYQHFIDREIWGGDPVDEITVKLPPYTWQTITPDQLAQQSDQLAATETTITNGNITLTWTPDKPGVAIKTKTHDWTDATQPVAPGTLIHEKIDGPHSAVMIFDDTETPIESRKPVWNPNPPITRQAAAVTQTTTRRTARTISVTQTMTLPALQTASVTWTLNADNPDIALHIHLHKLPDNLPHSIALALPFNLPKAQILVEMPGHIGDLDADALPNNCPWYSIQNAYAIGNKTHSATVTTLDTPMVYFRKFPLGKSNIGDSTLSADGLSFLWLYNNYWETNFKADDSGHQHYRATIRLTDTAPNPDTVMELATLAAQPVAYHPLPQTDPFAPAIERPLPTNGQLLNLTSAHTQLTILPSDEPNTTRLLLTNPTTNADTVTLSSAHLKLTAVAQLHPDGQLIDKLPLKNSELNITLAPKTSTHLRLTLS